MLQIVTIGLDRGDFVPYWGTECSRERSAIRALLGGGEGVETIGGARAPPKRYKVPPLFLLFFVARIAAQRPTVN